MYRSGSFARASSEYLVNLGTAGKGGSPAPAPKILIKGGDLPVYNPGIDVLKKENSGKSSSSGEKAIHLIPLLLGACFLVLWLFSEPVSVDGLQKL